MKRSLLLITSIMIVVACKQEPVVVKTNELNGFWEVDSAKRNGNKTSLLDGGYFHFSNSGNASTNIKGDTITAPFVVNGNLIEMKGQDPMIFQVNYISGDTINLSSKIGKSNFEFVGIKPKVKIR